MATIFTHPMVAVGLSSWRKPREKFWAILIAGMILTILPDIDVVGFRLGIPYRHLFGHRGFSHSIFFAIVASGAVSWLITRNAQLRLLPVWGYLFVCAMSHGLIDALTDGSYGIAFFSPFSNARYFFPFQPVEVSTLSIKRFFNGQGVAVLLSELIWLWIPCMIVLLVGLSWRLLRNRGRVDVSDSSIKQDK